VIIACFADGTTKSYGSPNENRWEKLWSSIRNVRDNAGPFAGSKRLRRTRTAPGRRSRAPQNRLISEGNRSNRGPGGHAANVGPRTG
jgi:hypothetical protein